MMIVDEVLDAQTGYQLGLATNNETTSHGSALRVALLRGRYLRFVANQVTRVDVFDGGASDVARRFDLGDYLILLSKVIVESLLKCVEALENRRHAGVAQGLT